MSSTLSARSTWAAAAGATVLAWYALPDFVRSRSARAAIKTGLAGLTAVGVAAIPDVWAGAPDVRAQVKHSIAAPPTPSQATRLLACLAGATVVSLWFEKAAFEHGERRRAQGVRLAHTAPAAAMALATAALALVDWPCAARPAG